MFKFLRSQAKVFYWVIAATFILFLFLGGMTGRGCQAPGTRQAEPGVVGYVNGQRITSQQYQFALSQQMGMMRQQAQGRELTSNQVAMAAQQAWDALVQNAIFEQEIEDRGIKATDQEVLDTFQNNPPPELLAQYRTEEGSLDLDRYYADLQNPEVDWSQAENYVRSLIPWRKLTEQIGSAAVVSDEEVREEYVRQTGRAVAEFMGVLYADLEGDFEPTNQEVSDWYDAHLEDYELGARATAHVVRFPKNPSEEDEEEVRTFMLEIREEIVSGAKTFEQAAAQYSEDQSNALKGGELGPFDRNRMVAPFTEAAFNLPVGELSEPVRTDFGYHLIEVLEQQIDAETGEVYEVNARHILLRVNPGPRTLDLIQQKAEDFRDRVDGDSFVMTAEAEAAELLTPPEFQEGRDIPSLPQSLQGSNFVFAAQAGDVSNIFENRDALYIVLAGEVVPAGTAPLPTVAAQVTLAVKKEKQKEAARALLGPAVGEAQMGRTLAEAASGHGLLHAVTDTFTINGNIPEVGYGTEFNKAAITGTVGTLVPEVETLRGLYALTPLWISEFDEAQYTARREGIRQALSSQAQNEVLQEWYEAKLAQSKVEDYRYTWR
jgi:parvulin-like peptidyl-prolyl isomerase